MTVCGIDYSLTSPALCFYTKDIDDGPINPVDCCYYFFDNNDSRWSTTSNMSHSSYPKYTTQIERYDKLSEWVITTIDTINHKINYIIIEDYAFSAKGKVFNIAENCGILKYKLYQNNLPFFSVSPTTIKKFATNKGNANKELMYEHWLNEGGIPLAKSSKNPDSDIVDSYFICKYGLINKDIFISS